MKFISVPVPVSVSMSEFRYIDVMGNAREKQMMILQPPTRLYKCCIGYLVKKRNNGLLGNPCASEFGSLSV